MLSQVLHPDARAVRRVLDGQTDQFAYLVRRYLPAVRAIALAHTRNAADADDVAQEVFLAAYRSLDRLQEPAKFRGWLMTIARNTTQSYLRTANRERAARENVNVDPIVPPHDLATEELRAHLHGQIDALDCQARELILLHYFSGYNAREIGDMLGLTHGAVRKRLQRARESLSDRMLAALRMERGDETERGAVNRTMAAVALLPISWSVPAGRTGMGVAAWTSAVAAAIVIGLGGYGLLVPARTPGVAPETEGLPTELADDAGGSVVETPDLAPPDSPNGDVAPMPVETAAPAPNPVLARIGEGRDDSQGTIWSVYIAGPSTTNRAGSPVPAGRPAGSVELFRDDNGIWLLGLTGEVGDLYPYLEGGVQDSHAPALRSPVDKPSESETGMSEFDSLLASSMLARSRLRERMERHRRSILLTSRRYGARYVACSEQVAAGMNATLRLDALEGESWICGRLSASTKSPPRSWVENWTLVPVDLDPDGVLRDVAAAKARMADVLDSLQSLLLRIEENALPGTVQEIPGWPETLPYEIAAYRPNEAGFWERLEHLSERYAFDPTDGSQALTGEEWRLLEHELAGAWGASFPRTPSVLTLRDTEYGVVGSLEMPLLGRFAPYVEIEGTAPMPSTDFLADRYTESCKEQLFDTGESIADFVEAHGVYPPGWVTLMLAYDLDSASCPCHPGARDVDYTLLFPGATRETVLAAGGSVLGLDPTPEERAAIAAATPLVVETAANHAGGRMVLFVDGRVEWVPGTDYERRIAPFLTKSAAGS